MPDFRVADTAPEHLKLRRAGLAAAGLWALSGAWSMRELTDGWTPDYWIQGWPSGGRFAASLVEAGLWVPDDRRGLSGFRFHDWEDFQRSADKIRDERARAAERAARHRARRAGSNGARAPVTSNVTRTVTDNARNANGTRESHDSLPLTLPPGGPGGREGSPPARADSQPPAPNPPRCPDHAAIPADQPVPACGACGDLRRQAHAESLARTQLELRQRQDLAAARRAAIDGCDRCDDQGWTDTGDGLVRCDHAHAEATAGGDDP